MVLALDHMRNRTKYQKLLVSWAAELGITGRLLYNVRMIRIIIEGSSDQVQEFVLRIRTRPVDVAKDGSPCRERMMSVLHQVGRGPPVLTPLGAVRTSCVRGLQCGGRARRGHQGHGPPCHRRPDHSVNMQPPSSCTATFILPATTADVLLVCAACHVRVQHAHG